MVMVLGGVDVRIAYVVQRLDFATVASEEIRSGRVAPFSRNGTCRPTFRTLVEDLYEIDGNFLYPSMEKRA